MRWRDLCWCVAVSNLHDISFGLYSWMRPRKLTLQVCNNWTATELFASQHHSCAEVAWRIDETGYVLHGHSRKVFWRHSRSNSSRTATIPNVFWIFQRSWGESIDKDIMYVSIYGRVTRGSRHRFLLMPVMALESFATDIFAFPKLMNPSKHSAAFLGLASIGTKSIHLN